MSNQVSDRCFWSLVGLAFDKRTKNFRLSRIFRRFAMGERRANRYGDWPVVTIFLRYAMLGKVAMLSRVRVSEREQTGDYARNGIGRHEQRV
jgi:hypothetical protein